MLKNNSIYVFIDESGNMDFSDKWTKYFVLSAIVTKNPIESSIPLQDLKYNLLKSNYWWRDFQHFHATEDKQYIRDIVFSEIDKINSIFVNWLYVEKSKIPAIYHKRDKFYTLLWWALSEYILKKYVWDEFEKIIIIFDKTLTKKEEDSFYKEVKPELKKIWKPYAIYFHQTLSDFNGQIADYCAWAKYVSLERSEFRPLSQIKNIPKNEFDIFEKISL